MMMKMIKSLYEFDCRSQSMCVVVVVVVSLRNCVRLKKKQNFSKN